MLHVSVILKYCHDFFSMAQQLLPGQALLIIEGFTTTFSHATLRRTPLDK